MYFQFRYRASRLHGDAQSDPPFAPTVDPTRASNRRTTSTSSRSGCVRETKRTTGKANADTSRLIATGQVGMRNARRLSGFTRQDSGCAFGQRISSSRAARRRRQPSTERDAGAAIPGAQQRTAQALPLTLGDDQRIGAPRAGDFRCRRP